MSIKGKSKFDEIVIEEGETTLNEKPSWNHLEKTSEEQRPREPYWDTLEVVGARRNLGPDAPNYKHEQRKRGWIVRLWRHYMRYWKLYVPLGITALAIALPILFLAIYPAIAQRIVDNASLPIQSASIFNPTPDSVVYSMSASLHVPAGLTVDLKPITLSLYTNETSPADPYIKVSLPEYHLKGHAQIDIVNQTATILDQAQFETFLNYAINSKEFFLSAYGATAAYLGILKANIHLKKQVELSGLDSISGFSFNSAALVFPPEADGTNLKGSVNLPNPSIVSFELGNVTLNMIVAGIVVGQGRMYDVTIFPGNNTVNIDATVDIKTLLSNLPAILAAESKSLINGNIMISATGNSTIYNGQHIPYYEAVLNNLVLTGSTPIVQVLIDSIQEYLGNNNSFVGSFLSALNGTSLLTEILGGLTGGNSTSGSSSLSGLLSGLSGLSSAAGKSG